MTDFCRIITATMYHIVARKSRYLRSSDVIRRHDTKAKSFMDAFVNVFGIPRRRGNSILETDR